MVVGILVTAFLNGDRGSKHKEVAVKGNQWKVFVSGIVVFMFLTSSVKHLPTVGEVEPSRPSVDLNERIDWGAQSTSGETSWFLTKDPDSSGGLDQGFVWGMFYRAGTLDWYIYEVEPAQVVIVRDSADTGMLTQLDVMPPPEDLDVGVESSDDVDIWSQDAEDGPILADPSWQVPLKTVFIAHDGIGECAVEAELSQPVCPNLEIVGPGRFMLVAPEFFLDPGAVSIGPWRGRLIRMEPAAFYLGYLPCTLWPEDGLMAGG